MHLVRLAESDGLRPKKVASTKGGEYHSPCPGCGGRDRFVIWDKIDRYFCRQCVKKGDSIQYLRDFHALSYSDACLRLGMIPREKADRSLYSRSKPIFVPQETQMPSFAWRSVGQNFVTHCHHQLLHNVSATEQLLKRGFSHETIRHFKLGWNPDSLWVQRENWGLLNPENKKLWLPQGLVIPTFRNTTHDLIKLKIRRNTWHEGDHLPKYVEIAGSMQSPGVYGHVSGKPIMVLESELDALLIQQFAGDRCCSMAFGGATKRTDVYCHEFLIRAPLILFTFDVDQAGANALRWWRQTYPQLKIWVPPIGKSPGDALQQGIDLQVWLEEGLR